MLSFSCLKSNGLSVQRINRYSSTSTPSMAHRALHECSLTTSLASSWAIFSPSPTQTHWLSFMWIHQVPSCQGCGGKWVTTSSTENKLPKALMCNTANFRGVNTLTMAIPSYSRGILVMLGRNVHPCTAPIPFLYGNFHRCNHSIMKAIFVCLFVFYGLY